MSINLSSIDRNIEIVSVLSDTVAIRFQKKIVNITKYFFCEFMNDLCVSILKEQHKLSPIFVEIMEGQN
jgi:hypothetical protein